MIRLYTQKRYRDVTYKIIGNKEDNVDIQDLIYRLQKSGYMYNTKLSMETPSNDRVQFVYQFTDDILTAVAFKRMYKEHRAKILSEKNWRK